MDDAALSALFPGSCGFLVCIRSVLGGGGADEHLLLDARLRTGLLYGEADRGHGCAAIAGWLWAVFPNAILLSFQSLWDTSLSALLGYRSCGLRCG